MVLELKKIKSISVSIVSPSICHEMMGPDAIILVFSQLFHSPLGRSLEGYGPWGHLELDTIERLHFHFSLLCIGEGNGNPLQ